MTTNITTTLPPVERAAVALNFDALKAEVSKQAQQYADIVAIENKAGRDQVHAAAMSLKNKRVEIQKRAKEVREDAVQFQKAVIAKGDELAAIIEPEEKRLIALRDEWDEAREAEKWAAAEAEAKRKAWHESQIAGIRGIVLKASGASSSLIGELIAEIEAIKPSEELHAEYMPIVARAQSETLEKLRAMKSEADAREAEQARIKAEQEAEAARLAAEREELANLRAEAAERQRAEAEAAEAVRKAEAEKLAAERAELERQRAEDAKKAEAIRKEAEAKLSAQRAEMEAQQRVMREQQAEIERQQQAIKAEQDRQGAEARAAVARKEAAERAEAEVKAAEAARVAAQKLRDEQESARVEAERKRAEEAAAARKKREATAPEAHAMVSVIAEAYDVSDEAARGWLVEKFGSAQMKEAA